MRDHMAGAGAGDGGIVSLDQGLCVIPRVLRVLVGAERPNVVEVPLDVRQSRWVMGADVVGYCFHFVRCCSGLGDVRVVVDQWLGSVGTFLGFHGVVVEFCFVVGMFGVVSLVCQRREFVVVGGWFGVVFSGGFVWRRPEVRGVGDYFLPVCSVVVWIVVVLPWSFVRWWCAGGAGAGPCVAAALFLVCWFGVFVVGPVCLVCASS